MESLSRPLVRRLVHHLVHHSRPVIDGQATVEACPPIIVPYGIEFLDVLSIIEKSA